MPGGLQSNPGHYELVGPNFKTGDVNPYGWEDDGAGWTGIVAPWSIATDFAKFGTKSLKWDATAGGSLGSQVLFANVSSPKKSSNWFEYGVWIRTSGLQPGAQVQLLLSQEDHSFLSGGIIWVHPTVSPVIMTGGGIPLGSYDIGISYVHGDGTEYKIFGPVTVTLDTQNAILVALPPRDIGLYNIYVGSAGGTMYRIDSGAASATAPTRRAYRPLRAGNSIYVDNVPTSGQTWGSWDGWLYVFGNPRIGGIHSGEPYNLRLKVLASTTGQVWFDGLSIREVDIPFHVIVPDRWWGYVKTGEDSDVEVDCRVNERWVQANLGLSNNSAVKLQIQMVDAVTPSTIYATQTQNPVGAGIEEFTLSFDMTRMPFSGQGVLVKSELRKVSDNSLIRSFADTKLIREDESFFSKIYSYIDKDGFLRLNGKRRILWGFYADYSAFYAEAVTGVIASQYKTAIAGMTTVATRDDPLYFYQSMREIGANAIINWTTYNNLDFRTERFTALTQAHFEEGVWHSQNVRELWLYRNAGNGPFDWFIERAIPPTDNDPAWAYFGGRTGNRKGYLGWYSMDEPGEDEIGIMFQQYKAFRDASVDANGIPGGLGWGTAVGSRTWNPVIRYCSDAFGPDAYVYHSATNDHTPVNDHISVTRDPTADAGVTYVYCADQVLSRPKSLNLLIAQYFEVTTGIDPDYKMAFQQAAQAFAAGVHGIWWWETGRTQSDHLTATVGSATGVVTDGTSTAYEGNLDAVTYSGGETFWSPTPNRIAIGARVSSGFIGDKRRADIKLGSTTIARPLDWSCDANGDLRMTLVSANLSEAKLNPDTGKWRLVFIAPPAAGQQIRVFISKQLEEKWIDLVDVTKKFMQLESVFTQPENPALVACAEADTVGAGTLTMSLDARSFTLSAGETMPKSATVTVDAGGATEEVLTIRSGSGTTYNTWEHAKFAHTNHAFKWHKGNARFGIWPHPFDAAERVVIACNLSTEPTAAITFTLASAAPVGAVVEVWGTSFSKADQANISLDGSRTFWTDTLGAHESKIYLVRRSASRVRLPTDNGMTKFALDHHAAGLPA